MKTYILLTEEVKAYQNILQLKDSKNEIQNIINSWHNWYGQIQKTDELENYPYEITFICDGEKRYTDSITVDGFKKIYGIKDNIITLNHDQKYYYLNNIGNNIMSEIRLRLNMYAIDDTYIWELQFIPNDIDYDWQINIKYNEICVYSQKLYFTFGCQILRCNDIIFDTVNPNLNTNKIRSIDDLVIGLDKLRQQRVQNLSDRNIPFADERSLDDLYWLDEQEFHDNLIKNIDALMDSLNKMRGE